MTGQDDEIEDPDERVLLGMLGEVVGGAKPPDVAAAVQARLRRGTAGGRRSPFWLGALAGAAAMLAGWSLLRREPAAPLPPVHLQVAEGCLEWHGAGTHSRASAPAAIAWPLAAGDRLAVCAAAGATTDIEKLGRLRMEPRTEIEVREMEWKPFATGAVLGAITVAVIHGAITWTGDGGGARAAAGESLELRATQDGAALSAAALAEQVAELEKALAAEKRRGEELAAAAARQPVPAGVPEGRETEIQEEKPPGLEHVVTYGGFEPVLAAIDWDVTGQAMLAMSAKLEALVKAIEDGEEVPLDVVAEIQRLNASLVDQAKVLIDAKVPGTGPNSAFTHPVVAANQIHASLAKAGIPLSDVQRDALQRLSAQLAGEDEARRAGLKADEIGLAAVLGEMEIKDRFYADARRLLTPQQEQALFHPRVDGTTSNVFSSGIAWKAFGQSRVQAADRADYANQVADSLARSLGLGDDVAPQVRAVVAGWAKSVPEEAFRQDARLADLNQPTAAVRDAAARQVNLLRELMRTLPLTSEQKAKLRQSRAVFVPYGKGR